MRIFRKEKHSNNPSSNPQYFRKIFSYYSKFTSDLFMMFWILFSALEFSEIIK